MQEMSTGQREADEAAQPDFVVGYYRHLLAEFENYRALRVKQECFSLPAFHKFLRARKEMVRITFQIQYLLASFTDP